jgi:hypothetical protein
MCNNWPDFPIDVGKGATGGLIGDTVIICGGIGVGGSISDECYSLTSEKVTPVTHMTVGRFHAASIVINDKTLWVTGGRDGGWYSLASTEYMTMTGTMLGPDLPMAHAHHAMVAINSTCSMVIGGEQGEANDYYSALTFFYDHNEEEWINGPSLMQERYDCAAGIVTDEVTGEHFVAVTGGINDDSSYLNTTDILQDGEWVQGKINDTICYLLEYVFKNIFKT